MIHLIYIYFIISAFVAGMVENEAHEKKMTFLAILFGAHLSLYILLMKLLRILK